MSDKDVWDKLEIIVAAIGGILVPLAIGLAGYFISEADKENARLVSASDRETARLTWQAEQMTDLISHLSSENAKERQIAVEISIFLAKSKQLPEGFITTLTWIANNSSNSNAAASAGLVAQVVSTQDQVSRVVVENAFSGVPARVYFHVASEKQMDSARQVELKLEQSMENLVVPGIELKEGPKKTELRYFSPSEKSEAEKIASNLQSQGLPVALKDLSGIYGQSGGIRPRHYELWYGKDA